MEAQRDESEFQQETLKKSSLPNLYRIIKCHKDFMETKDLATIEKFNRELLGEPNIDDCGIIDQFVILYRTSVYDTETNMYGEASQGKVYKQGVKLPCIVDCRRF